MGAATVVCLEGGRVCLGCDICNALLEISGWGSSSMHGISCINTKLGVVEGCMGVRGLGGDGVGGAGLGAGMGGRRES